MGCLRGVLSPGLGRRAAPDRPADPAARNVGGTLAKKGSGFRAYGLGFGVRGFRFIGFTVWGLRCRVTRNRPTTSMQAPFTSTVVCLEPCWWFH